MLVTYVMVGGELWLHWPDNNINVEDKLFVDVFHCSLIRESMRRGEIDVIEIIKMQGTHSLFLKMIVAVLSYSVI